jgi:broad specificity phosphatase PhoE
MKTLGLMRHIRIPHRQYQWMDSRGFADWSVWYDRYDVAIPSGLKPLIGWDTCYCSDLPRAQKTARAYFEGNITAHESLREVPFAPIRDTEIRLPLLAWQALSRLGWRYAHHSQSESREQTFQRIDVLLDELEQRHAMQKVLLVSHGFLMQYLKQRLIRRGYAGNVPLRPVWGEVYTFEAP